MIVHNEYTWLKTAVSYSGTGAKLKKCVVGNVLLAIACKFSWDMGHEGYVQFTAKRDFVKYYQKMLNVKRIEWYTLYIDVYVCKSRKKDWLTVLSTSYDALNAYTAIVFTRYMMLFVAQRRNTDHKTMCELYFRLVLHPARVHYLYNI